MDLLELTPSSLMKFLGIPSIIMVDHGWDVLATHGNMETIDANKGTSSFLGNILLCVHAFISHKHLVRLRKYIVCVEHMHTYRPRVGCPKSHRLETIEHIKKLNLIFEQTNNYS